MQESVDYWGRYEEPVTVRFAVRGEEDGFAWDDNIWTQAWEEDFNIKTEILWSTATDDAYNTKLSLAILSGDLPDYICTHNYNQFLQLVDGGSAADIGEIYDNWLYPQIHANLNMDGVSQAFGVIDGVRYGINTQGGLSTDTRLVLIRSDYMEAVGAEAPTTIEEVIELGKLFVDEGLAKYALPLTGKVIAEGYSDIRVIANAFGAYPEMWVQAEDGSIGYGSVRPGMNQALDVYKDLYDTGYVDPAFATAVGDTLTAQILNGEVGILLGDFWIYTWPLPDLKDENGAIIDWISFTSIPSETNDDYKAQGGISEGKMVVIRAGFEHPEAIAKLMNHRCAVLDDPELANMDFQQLEEDGKMVATHMRSPIREYFSFPYANMYTSPAVTEAIDKGAMEALVRPHDGVQYENVSNYLAAVKANDVEGMNANWAMSKLFYGEDSVFGGFYRNYMADQYIFDATGGYQSLNYSRLWGTLAQYENTFYVNYIGGTEDTSFEEFVQIWNDMGGELLTYELNNR